MALLALSGCLAKAAVNVVTAPVKIAGKAADMATTSQSEADEKRGRDLRKREERLGKLEREWRKQDKACADGSREACAQRDNISDEMDALRPTIPALPED
ncbi:MAG TPA: hypothetical protein VL017_00750 [Devosia sp.]|nr:hypothetical protein [Devosia sp.]